MDCPSLQVGDVVRILDDMAEVMKLQQNHGEWAEEMALVSVLDMQSHLPQEHSDLSIAFYHKENNYYIFQNWVVGLLTEDVHS